MLGSHTEPQFVSRVPYTWDRSRRGQFVGGIDSCDLIIGKVPV